ncbi:MAG: thiolase family protein [Alphaproteobacteria bacterium]|nr:thiolase family protein [Alphaproteobacteria bacterium]
MPHAVICAYARTPFAPAQKGALAKIRPDELLGQLLKGFLAKTNVTHADIEDLKVGCAFPEGEQGLNIGRIAVFLAGLPVSVGGVTINRFCGSSMQAIHDAVGAIACAAGEAFLCAGVESMSRIPMGGYNLLPHPKLYEANPDVYIGMGETAENVAKKWNISRADQDAFALKSHQKAAAAKLTEEIIPVTRKEETIAEDGCIRPDTSLEKLALLAPAFLANGGVVTAGNASPLTDGAAVVLVCSEAYADKKGLTKLARIKSFAVSGCSPEIMGIGPVEASRKALARAGVGIPQLDVIELNEAFASQSIACIRELGLDESKINLDGGAIALGHPLGATGARITGKAAQLLHRTGGQYALATQCIGGGQGIATVLEKV